MHPSTPCTEQAKRLLSLMELLHEALESDSSSPTPTPSTPDQPSKENDHAEEN